MRSRLDFSPLCSARDDFLNPRRNPFISFQPTGIAAVGFVARQDIGLGGSFAPGEGLCEVLVARIGKGATSRESLNGTFRNHCVEIVSSEKRAFFACTQLSGDKCFGLLKSRYACLRQEDGL